MQHRGAEQRGADGLGVITARDEKKVERRQWGGGEEGEARGEMGDKTAEGLKKKKKDDM